MKFYNRKYELAELERVSDLCGKSMHFTIISGRRRVGKTELVKKFCSDKEHYYFFIGRKKPTLLLEELSLIAKTKINIFPTITKFDEWLEFLLANANKETVIFFDEFQNFKYVDESIFSDFQKIFDWYKNKLQLHIIVAGSHITLMNKIFSDSKEPLFGRATEKYVLKPLLFRDVAGMLAEIKITDIEEQIKWYSIFGGIPKYYVIAEEQGLEGQDILSALKILLLRDFAPLKEEAKSVLTEEFGSEHASYFSILEAVALGNSEMTTIANKSGINIKSISKYLALLAKDFGYLDYEVPVTEDKPWKSKKGRYFLSDNFFKFWFRFIYRNRSDYEIGNYDAIMDKVKQDFGSLIGREFEKISKEFLIEMDKSKNLPFHSTKIGKWWHKDEEIDIVALNEDKNEILFCECKWQNLSKKASIDILNTLKTKSGAVDWHVNDRKEYFGLIAKHVENKEQLKSDGYLVFDLRDL
ncbi:Archaea bacterial proteins of uncharacterised function [uncultured archaeon]|nr:Archaea bacterial proteins of uncharacterised function [uncultured archaeon]